VPAGEEAEVKVKVVSGAVVPGDLRDKQVGTSIF